MIHARQSAALSQLPVASTDRRWRGTGVGMRLDIAFAAFLAMTVSVATPAAETAAGVEALPAWALGPFVKQHTPVLEPNPAATFSCPVAGKVVHWESQNVYNPAVVVKDNKVWLLYRADDEPRPSGWGRTCRIGLAVSSDGRNFTRFPEPVIYPDNDAFKQYEWEGGCEDIHIIEDEAGTYYVNYTAWNGKTDSIGIATSTDLRHWTKHGPAFGKAYGGKFIFGTRTGAVVCRRDGERLVAARIQGKYWMYWKIGCYLASSDNLIDWTPLLGEQGQPVSLLPPRPRMFDSGCAESGAIALLTQHGIVHFYNALNHPAAEGGDKNLVAGWSGLGQALFAADKPERLVNRLESPFIRAEFPWELSGFTPPAVVANGMVLFHGEWLLYYGAADRRIGLAVCKPTEVSH